MNGSRQLGTQRHSGTANKSFSATYHDENVDDDSDDFEEEPSIVRDKVS